MSIVLFNYIVALYIYKELNIEHIEDVILKKNNMLGNYIGTYVFATDFMIRILLFIKLF